MLGRIKKIRGLEKFDDTKNVVNADDKWPDDSTFKRWSDINEMRY